MSKFLVLNTEPELHNLRPEETEPLARIGAFIIALRGGEEEFNSRAGDADAVLNADFPLPAPLIQKLRRCRIIARFGTGVDNIDVEAATGLGIMVANVPNFCTEEAADRTFTFLLACACRLLKQDSTLRHGVWRSAEIGPVTEVVGKSLGLVGYGHIARAVARRARAFAMKVFAFDPYVAYCVIEDDGTTPCTLESLLANSDFISLHTPATPETRHIINEKTLALVKPRSILINCARGALVDQDALIAALQGGRLAAAGLDVFEKEPVTPDNPLLGMENVILTPHTAAQTPAAINRVHQAAVDAIVQVLSGGHPLHIVNPEVLQKKSYLSP